MALDVSTGITIQRPREAVAAYAANPDKAPLWYENIKSVQWRNDPPLAIGSRIDFVAHFLGRRLAYTYDVVEWLPLERLVMRTSEGPFPMETRYLWEEIEHGTTRMTLRNLGYPIGFSKLYAPFMAMAMRHANRKDLSLLKRLLEKGE